jgi:thiol peroxidase
VPSLDTSVCSTQTKKFNEAASQLPESVKVLTISMDLPFAQKRFCGAEGIDRIEVLSDHREGAFGQALWRAGEGVADPLSCGVRD